MNKYEFVNYFWGIRARMHYNAKSIREMNEFPFDSQEYYGFRREIRAFADGLSWMPNFSYEDHKKFIRIGEKYLNMVKRGAINPRFDNYGE